jgi:thioredoxin-related protein
MIRSAVAAIAFMLSTSAALAQANLVMFEEVGCMWCARWNEEVADIYALSVEGMAAPLVRLQIDDSLPADVVLQRRVTFTPTFVLLQDGVEAGRIEGYPGEDFFWGLLVVLFDRAGIETAANLDG